MEGHGRSSVSLPLDLREHCLCAKSQSENSDFFKSHISTTSFCYIHYFNSGIRKYIVNSILHLQPIRSCSLLASYHRRSAEDFLKAAKSLSIISRRTWSSFTSISLSNLLKPSRSIVYAQSTGGHEDLPDLVFLLFKWCYLFLYL